MPGVSSATGRRAQGELTALMVAAAYFRQRGETRTKVLAPDSSHGTNPASATMAGFQTVTIRSADDGCVDLEDLKRKLDDQVAVFMITNPNTLGLFDRQVAEIARCVHQQGGLIYLDGANMNAILGITRPGDFGADMMHYNPHKTFSGPHGGGGPGAGPICVTRRTGTVSAFADRRAGRRIAFAWTTIALTASAACAAFFGNVGVLVRAFAYIRSHGPDGLRQVSENAVLNANYLLSRVKHILPGAARRPLHARICGDRRTRLKKDRGVTAMDLAKRLLDYGFHAPTVYFPLTVPECLMIEPTETESRETLDAFAETLFRVTEESAELLHEAPHTTLTSRPDEVRAARQPVMKWQPASAEPKTKGRLVPLPAGPRWSSA